MATYPKVRTMTTHQIRELVESAKIVFENAEYFECAEMDDTTSKNFSVPYGDMRRLYSILAELHVIPHGFRKKKTA